MNTLIAASGETITARARWLVRNNGYAANAVEAFANHVVGDGIKPSSKIADAAKKEELQGLWLAWTDEADAEGLTDFFGLQRRAAREVFLAGEVFLRIRMRRVEDGLTVPLQLLPSEMLPQDMTRVLPGAGSIRQGIEFDGIGRRVAYHFLRRHPGDLTDPGLAGETVRVPASEVIHILDPVEAGQLRGVSRLAAAVVKLFTLDLYDDAELERKKTAAMFAMFITSPAPETALDPAEDDLEVEPGQVVRLDPGEDVTTPSTPDSGSTYEPFPFAAAVFDEIQAIKNPASLRAAAARAVKADFRIGLTGTPIENSTVDLWAIMDQLAPGALGTLREFRSRYGEPDEANMSDEPSGDDGAATTAEAA